MLSLQARLPLLISHDLVWEWAHTKRPLSDNQLKFDFLHLSVPESFSCRQANPQFCRNSASSWVTLPIQARRTQAQHSVLLNKISLVLFNQSWSTVGHRQLCAPGSHRDHFWPCFCCFSRHNTSSSPSLHTARLARMPQCSQTRHLTLPCRKASGSRTHPVTTCKLLVASISLYYSLTSCPFLGQMWVRNLKRHKWTPPGLDTSVTLQNIPLGTTNTWNISLPHTEIIITLHFCWPFTRSSSLQLFLLTSQFESAAGLCLTLTQRTKITALQGMLQHLCSLPPYSSLLPTTSWSFPMKYRGKEGEIQVKELFWGFAAIEFLMPP